MNKDIFFRMNFVIQDNNATTTKTYLIKIIESILFENKSPLTIQEINNIIFETYHLEFAEDELQKAVCNKNAHVQIIDDKYILLPAYAAKMSKTESVSNKLNRLIMLFLSENHFEIKQTEVRELITRYLYYSFNSNKNMLLSLIEGKQISDAEKKFDATNEEINIINQFLMWNNEDKNKLIYQIISYCYIYCSLTTKKDSLLSKSLFKNKHFILDANIIFRLAGINNDERQKTVFSFVKKCKEVGIRLSYTNNTFDELYRVIKSKVQWIKKITHSEEPLDIVELNAYGNDFYNLYIEWCKEPCNKYDDFMSFHNNLVARVNEVIEQLNYISFENFKTDSKGNFKNYVESLKQYKNEHSNKIQSDASIETDVNNVIYVQKARVQKEGSIFSINDFFISADQNLIAWSKENFSGVPLIMLPSIWLTIILRFTGRTDNDYQAFCSFMSLRSHHNSDNIDIFNIIRELGFHTNSKELKEKIVREVLLNHEDYMFDDDDDYKETIDKAFDVIVSQNEKIKDLEFQKKIIDKDKMIESEMMELQKLTIDQERQRNIDAMVSVDVSKRKSTMKIINTIFWAVSFMIAGVLIVVTIMWFYDIEPMCIWFEKLLPKKIIEMDTIINFMPVFWGIMLIIFSGIKKIINYFISDKYYKKYRDKLYIKYKNIINP